ncbi:NmrA family transcriptional regulator [Actinorhabdospora filicis]|uniref:NmrA family transcriptional regulator n=1 Tax=Actinorhabdospora filicis TaxID=1785913 RepID=A0A9W6SNF9_9ACTN|nr:NAD(P)H-binding protein [Actinorhabdospora filicis]GLZ80114.1 NmrA family transcriptional regulator [Actinorhabdospora filicis]
MRIAITTPTGNVGRHLLPALIRAGTRPRVLIRDPERLDPELAPYADVVTADQGDRDAVLAATEDVDALYWVDPPTVGPDPVGAYERFGAIAAEAVRANGIGRVVFQSSVGAEKRHGAGEIDGLARTELLLEETGADVLHLRNGFFFSNLMFEREAIRAGTIAVILPVDAPMAWVAPRDIAEVAAGRLLGPDWPGRAVQAVHGPADLSWAEVAGLLTEATGRPVRAERISDDAMRERLTGAGLPPGYVEGVLGMSTGLREGFVPEQPRTPLTTTPTTLESWIREELLPAL